MPKGLGMNTPTKLRKSEIPAVLLAAFPAFKGRKFRLDASGKVTLSDLNWGGGTRNEFVLVSLDGQGAAALPKESPWNPRAEGMTFAIPERWVVVEHSVFCGQDCGLTFHVNPADLAKLLKS